MGGDEQCLDGWWVNEVGMNNVWMDSGEWGGDDSELGSALLNLHQDCWLLGQYWCCCLWTGSGKIPPRQHPALPH